MARPVLLIVRDGWGLRRRQDGNATVLAHTPQQDRWVAERECCLLDASGVAVGLPVGQMGNSEVGHLNLGAGRVVWQESARVSQAAADGSLGAHPELQATVSQLRETGGRLHLIGLLGPGGVHSFDAHLYAILASCAAGGIDPYLHIITDGRDTPPRSALRFCQELRQELEGIGVGRPCTLSGRYYAMDRDRRWPRTRKYVDALVARAGDCAATAEDAIQSAYDSGTSDEFIPPAVLAEGEGGELRAGDAVLLLNFRADRMRQLARALTAPDSLRAETAFADLLMPPLRVLSMTQYDNSLPAQVLFPQEILGDTLAETIAAAGLRQFHAAETEKYPHVTYFFNGRAEAPFPGEERQIIPSPAVATYDQQPRMSADELTEALLVRIEQGEDDFTLVNFANPDMVGHTGDLAAAVAACECVDDCAGRLVRAMGARGGISIVTADHGNAETMVEPLTGEPHTYHTTNPVELFVLGGGEVSLAPRGSLADVAPTVLNLLGLASPEVMTGRSLILGQR